MMERRILKDFQIGIVESISEAVKNSTDDVFSSIAKAINKRSSNRKYVIHLDWNFLAFIWFTFSFHFIDSISKKEDWNAIVRQSKKVRDPIGSTRNSLSRRDRRSLRRQILAEVDRGLNMNTQKIIGMSAQMIPFFFSTYISCSSFLLTLANWKLFAFSQCLSWTLRIQSKIVGGNANHSSRICQIYGKYNEKREQCWGECYSNRNRKHQEQSS